MRLRIHLSCHDDITSVSFPAMQPDNFLVRSCGREMNMRDWAFCLEKILSFKDSSHYGLYWDYGIGLNYFFPTSWWMGPHMTHKTSHISSYVWVYLNNFVTCPHDLYNGILYIYVKRWFRSIFNNLENCLCYVRKKAGLKSLSLLWFRLYKIVCVYWCIQRSL